MDSSETCSSNIAALDFASEGIKTQPPSPQEEPPSPQQGLNLQDAHGNKAEEVSKSLAQSYNALLQETIIRAEKVCGSVASLDFSCEGLKSQPPSPQGEPNLQDVHAEKVEDQVSEIFGEHEFCGAPVQVQTPCSLLAKDHNAGSESMDNNSSSVEICGRSSNLDLASEESPSPPQLIHDKLEDGGPEAQQEKHIVKKSQKRKEGEKPTQSNIPEMHDEENEVEDGRTQEEIKQEGVKARKLQNTHKLVLCMREAMEKVETRHTMYSKHKKFSLRVLQDMDILKLQKFAADMGGVQLTDIERENKKIVLDKVARKLMSKNQVSYTMMRGKNIYQEMLQVGALIFKWYTRGIVEDVAWDFQGELTEVDTVAEFLMEISVRANLALPLMELIIHSQFVPAMNKMLE